MPVVIKHNTTGKLFKTSSYPKYEWVDNIEDADLWHHPHVAEHIVYDLKLNAQLEHVAIGA